MPLKVAKNKSNLDWIDQSSTINSVLVVKGISTIGTFHNLGFEWTDHLTSNTPLINLLNQD
jgi:hypothetical protein